MKLPIFYAEKRPTLFMLEKGARKAGFDPQLFHFSDIELTLDRDLVDLRFRNIPVKNFPLVFVREVRDYTNELSLLAKFCKVNKIPIFDSALLQSRGGVKIDGILRRSLTSLPSPKTFFLEKQDALSRLTKVLDFPIVAKENRGRQGKEVYLLKTKSELERFVKKLSLLKKTLDTPSYIFQEFIPSDFDIRVLVVGDKVLGAIERKSTRKGEFRHNVALGASARQIPVTKEIERLALKAERVSEYEFAGVDLIQHRETGKYFILEVNRSPEFSGFMEATGIDVPGEMMKFFLRFISS